MRIAWQLPLAALAAAGLLSGCTGGKAIPAYYLGTGGSPQRGKQVIVQYKCGSCHEIPGVPGAHGNFGPPLDFMSRRTYIAGDFPNVPVNLVHWIQAPTSMKPKTAMPDLGLSKQEAADAAAYLQTLR